MELPATALRSFPLTSDGEPECSQIIKIGNRWYLTTGIFTNIPWCRHMFILDREENKTIDEVNWKIFPTHKLTEKILRFPN